MSDTTIASEALARWEALRPRVEAVPVNDELDADAVTEAISVARSLDRIAAALAQSTGPTNIADAQQRRRINEARAWFRDHHLPTTYGQSPEQHRTGERR